MMTRTSYEITLHGKASPELLAELGDAVQVAEPAQTVLLTDRIDQAELHRLVAVIRDLGLELVEVHRLAPGRPRPVRPSGQAGG